MQRNGGSRYSIGCAAVLLFGHALAAGDYIVRDERLTGTYSSLCVHDETGDMLGFEVSFVFRDAENSATVLYQHAEGELAPPTLLRLTRPNLGLPFRNAGDPEGPIELTLMPEDTLRVRLIARGSQEATWEETLVRRKPAWSTDKKFPHCTGREGGTTQRQTQ